VPLPRLRPALAAALGDEYQRQPALARGTVAPLSPYPRELPPRVPRAPVAVPGVAQQQQAGAWQFGQPAQARPAVGQQDVRRAQPVGGRPRSVVSAAHVEPCPSGASGGLDDAVESDDWVGPGQPRGTRRGKQKRQRGGRGRKHLTGAKWWAQRSVEVFEDLHDDRGQRRSLRQSRRPRMRWAKG
jgi:hypothetical protein